MPVYEHPSLRQGLVGAWCPSLGASGLSLIDRSGRNNHGTLVGSITAAPGGLGADLSTSQYLDVGSASRVYQSLTSATISMWIRPRTFPNAYMTLWETTNPNTPGVNQNYQLGANLKSNGKLAFFATANAAATVQTSYDGTGAYTLAANTWYHLAFVFLGSARQEGWVNGNLDASVSSPISSITASTSAIRSGFSVFGTRNINGQIDDVRCYSQSLTVPEIRLLASCRGISLTPLPDRAAGLPRKLSVNVGGTDRPSDAYLNVGGAWKLSQASINVAGVWK
jgi:hypothetical protein